MGSETNTSSASASASASASPSGKRSRDPEDEVYVDNLHSHKRYLSEIMASSLNGLKVEDHFPESLMDSPARSDSMFYLRDELPLEYSPMSEDSEGSLYYETPISTCSSLPDSVPTSPVSPYRYQRPLSGFSSSPPTSSYPLHGSTASAAAVPSAQPRQRGSDSEGRFPSSPSDICHSADLRRAALMRSVQMRTQSPGPSPLELPFSPGQEPVHIMESEEQPCSYTKSIVDESYEREYKIVSEPENRETSCTMLNMNVKGDYSAE